MAREELLQRGLGMASRQTRRAVSPPVKHQRRRAQDELLRLRARVDRLVDGIHFRRAKRELLELLASCGVDQSSGREADGIRREGGRSQHRAGFVELEKVIGERYQPFENSPAKHDRKQPRRAAGILGAEAVLLQQRDNVFVLNAEARRVGRKRPPHDLVHGGLYTSKVRPAIS
jgi:hypothetical protein